jgi:hypothetical protein
MSGLMDFMKKPDAPRESGGGGESRRDQIVSTDQSAGSSDNGHRPRRREAEVYEARKAELLGESEGKWVVIGGDEVLGTWPTEAEAMDAGCEKYGSYPFLIRQITAEEPVCHFAHDLPR